jgi:hypothetical protein
MGSPRPTFDPPGAPGATGSHLPFLGMPPVVAGGAEQPKVAHLGDPAVPHLADVVHGVAWPSAEPAAAGIAGDHLAPELLPGASVIAPVCRIALLGRRSPTQGAMLWRAMRHGYSTMQADHGRMTMLGLRVMQDTKQKAMPGTAR